MRPRIVLVIDDCPLVRRELSLAMSAAGLHVVLAASRVELRAVLGGVQVDAIVCARALDLDARLLAEAAALAPSAARAVLADPFEGADQLGPLAHAIFPRTGLDPASIARWAESASPAPRGASPTGRLPQID